MSRYEDSATHQGVIAVVDVPVVDVVEISSDLPACLRVAIPQRLALKHLVVHWAAFTKNVLLVD